MKQDVVLKRVKQQLEQSHGDLAQSYAERILMHVFACNRTELYLNGNRDVTQHYRERITAIARRAAAHEPLEYILHSAYFFNRQFKVTNGVLIPRPDTETLVQQVLCHEGEEVVLFAEVGVGTGIISCVLTEQRPNWCAVGIDISSAAVALSRENCRNNKIQLLRADALTALKPKSSFDFIVSNPPYICTDTIAELDVSVRRFEPQSALDGGVDGLAFYRYFAEQAPLYLKPGGRLYCEIGYDQKHDVINIFTDDQWKSVDVFRDNGGNYRVMVARLHQQGVAL